MSFNVTSIAGLNSGPIFGIALSWAGERGLLPPCTYTNALGVLITSTYRQNVPTTVYGEGFDIRADATRTLSGGMQALGDLTPEPDYLSVYINGGDVGLEPGNQCLGPWGPTANWLPTSFSQSVTADAGVLAGSPHSYDSNDPHSVRSMTGWLERDTAPVYAGDPDNDATNVLFAYDELHTIDWNLNDIQAHAIAVGGGMVTIRTYTIVGGVTPEPDNYMMVV